MANLISKDAQFVNGGGTFDYTFLGTGSNRLVLVLAVGTAGGSQTLSSLTLDGVGGAEIYAQNASSSTYANFSIYAFTDAQHPGAGTFTFTPTWSAVAKAAYAVIEVSDAAQVAPFIKENDLVTYQEDIETGSLDAILSSSIGELAFFYTIMGDGSTQSPSIDTLSANLSALVTSDSTDKQAWVAVAQDGSVATSSESYTANYDNGRPGVASDNVGYGAFSITPYAAPAFSAGPPDNTTPEYGEVVTVPITSGVGPYTATLNGDALTIDSQNATQIVFTMPDIKTFGSKTASYDVAQTIVITDTSDSDTDSTTITPAVKTGDYHDTLTATTGIYADDVGVAIGDRGYGTVISGTIVAADMATGAIAFDSGGGTLRYWIQDDTDGVWGASADETITPDVSPSVVPAASRTSVFQIANYLRSLGTYNSSQCNELVVEWLVSEGITRTQINQMLYAYLGGLGYTGSFNDRLKAWSEDV